jgi:ribosome-binding ATPase
MEVGAGAVGAIVTHRVVERGAARGGVPVERHLDVRDEVLVRGEEGKHLGQPLLDLRVAALDATGGRVVEEGVGREDVVEPVELLGIERPGVAGQHPLDLVTVGELLGSIHGDPPVTAIGHPERILPSHATSRAHAVMPEHLGVLGLADSGHAALFAALTGNDASTASDRQLGVVSIPDERLAALARMSESKQVVAATLQLAYLPGLSTEPGKGLGSRLLGSVRDCDALMLVVRTDGEHDPGRELAALEEELILADLGSVEGRLDKQRRAAKGDKSLAGEVAALERAEAVLSDGVPIYRSDLSAAERAALGPAFLLTNKPALVVVNIGVDQLEDGDGLAAPFGEDALAVCIELEGDPDVVAAEGEERAELLVDLGIPESVVPRLARAALHLLGRSTFLTTGEKESRAWTFRTGSTAPECAGVIHSDLQRGFIRAEVIEWRQLLAIGSWTKARESGDLRVEGKDYVVRDGDVLEIRFNV